MSLKGPVEQPYDWQKLSQTDKENIKQDRMRLEIMLEADGAKFIPEGPGKFRCPYHNDKNPSAEIRELPSGYYFVCYACDLHLDYFALVKYRENVPLSEAFKKAATSLDDAMSYLSAASSPPQQAISLNDWLAHAVKAPDSVVSVHHFTDEFMTVRIQTPNGKKVLPVSKTDRGWAWKALKDKTPLYNLKRVQEAENVVIVEGEKCVDMFTDLGIAGWAATTSAGGAKAEARTDWSPLVGKNVCFWRDNDEPGQKYETNVIELLKPVKPTTLSIVAADKLMLPEGGDVVDFLDAIEPPDRRHAIYEVLENAPLWDNLVAYRKRMQAKADGTWQVIEIPNLPRTSALTQAGQPGKMTLISGPPGSAKSFMLMEAGWMLHEAGVPVSTLFLEDGTVDYQDRCVAQMAGRSEYTNAQWYADHQHEAHEIFDSVSQRVKSYFDHVTCMESKIITPDGVLAWMVEKVNDGYRVLMIDPVTAMQMSRDQWLSDQNFVMTAQNIIVDGAVSLFATTHPKTSKDHDMAGGQSWPRFSHTNITLQTSQQGLKKGQPKMSRIEHIPGEQTIVEHKRMLQITKARNGAGEWNSIAVDLDPTTLRFREYGVILGDAVVGPSVNVEEDPNPQF